MKNFLSRIKSAFSPASTRGSFFRATTILAGGTATGQLVALLASPIISRLYTQEQFGTLGTFATILSCVAPIACLRFEAAISLPEDEATAARLLVLSLLSVVLTSLLTFLAVAFGGVWLASACHDPGLRPYLWLLPLSLAGAGAYLGFSYWAIRQREFGLAARTKIIQGTAMSACKIGLGLAKTGAAGLILGDVLGRVLGAGSIASLAWKKIKGELKAVKRAELLSTAKKYRAFPVIASPAMVVHTATTTFTLLLAPMYGPAVMGQYFFGVANLWGPVALVGQSLAQVYLGEASRWSRDDPEQLLRAFDQIVKKLALFGAVPFGILLVAGGPLTALIFGSRWFEAGVLVQIQAISWWAMFVVGPVLNTLNILGRQPWQLWANVFGLALMSVAFALSVQFHWQARIAVGLYSLAITLMYIWLFLACRRSIVLALKPLADNSQ